MHDTNPILSRVASGETTVLGLGVSNLPLIDFLLARGARITVRDKGRGIDDVKKAMEPLFTTGGEDRSGMGFTIMDSFMDKLRVKSSPGKGTTVTMLRGIRPRQKS